MSKVEGGGVRLPPPPRPSRLRVTIFSRRLLGLIYIHTKAFVTNQLQIIFIPFLTDNNNNNNNNNNNSNNSLYY